MNDNKTYPSVCNFQSLIRSNFDCAGQFASLLTLWQIYPILSFKKSYLSKRNPTRYFWKNLHTNSRYTRMAPKLLQNIKISSIIALIPEIGFLSSMKTSSISITVTCSLIRVPILRRVYINIISHSSLKLFIISE